jgi:hypothetical protein
MPQQSVAWNDTQEFVRTTRKNIMESEASAEQKSSGGLDFALVERVAERIGERFGAFHAQDCIQMKDSLVKIEYNGTGRVLLSDFYKLKHAPVDGSGKSGLDNQWQFQYSPTYLRKSGALDESNPSRPSVMIANFITSPSNCAADSSFYSVCCVNECEGLLGHLEREIAAPDATSSHIAKLISELSSSSVIAPRKLSPVLLNRLEEVAATHGGTVPLHGRLFAQWMHHAFPRECPFPHAPGTIMAFEESDDLLIATTSEMQAHIEKAEKSQMEEGSDGSALPWSPEEEHYCTHAMQSDRAVTRNAIAFMVMTSIAFGTVRNAFAPRDATIKTSGCEKYLV